ncbi:hypothetical protein EIP86_004905 [Pleurotus ostreatoroseus]|nr:hypothetical protein EIP86_004905 [Pleurotus ostreatoroseus]
MSHTSLLPFGTYTDDLLKASPLPEKKPSLNSINTCTSQSSFDIIDRTQESSLVQLGDPEVLPTNHALTHEPGEDEQTRLMDWTFVCEEERENTTRGVVIEKTAPFSHITRYHRSQMKIIGRSNIKEGWWAGCVKVNLGTTTVFMKQYDGDVQSQEWA